MTQADEAIDEYLSTYARHRECKVFQVFIVGKGGGGGGVADVAEKAVPQRHSTFPPLWTYV